MEQGAGAISCPVHPAEELFHKHTSGSLPARGLSPHLHCRHGNFFVPTGTEVALLTPAGSPSLKLAWVHPNPTARPRGAQETAFRQTSANCSLHGAVTRCKSSLCLHPLVFLHFSLPFSFFPSLKPVASLFFGLSMKLHGPSVIDNLPADLSSLQMERVRGCPLSEQPSSPGESIIRKKVAAARGRMAHG